MDWAKAIDDVFLYLCAAFMFWIFFGCPWPGKKDDGDE
jgi:hypothetical protein